MRSVDKMVRDLMQILVMGERRRTLIFSRPTTATRGVSMGSLQNGSVHPFHKRAVVGEMAWGDSSESSDKRLVSLVERCLMLRNPTTACISNGR